MISCPMAIALVHHPVIDRRGDLVTTAVTNLDLHDIARTARTFGVRRFYVVTPVEEQRRLIERIIAHWRSGHGAAANPHRGEALGLIEVIGTLDDALADWRKMVAATPLPILTGAGRKDGISFDHCRKLAGRQPALLIFGTGWGLGEELFSRGWTVLEPVAGTGGYNHLPVRAAAAIVLDRLLTRT